MERQGRGGFASFFETLLISLFVMSLIFTYFVRLVTVSGDSMLNTLSSGDKVIVSLFSGDPEPGDIIVAFADESVLLDDNGKPVSGKGPDITIVKRVIAVAGQTVDFDFPHGIVYVDGQPLKEKYTSSLTHLDEGAFTGKYPVTVPDGYVFVLGDNRHDSKDSRWDGLGFVPVDDIIGKVLLRLTPFSKFGSVS